MYLIFTVQSTFFLDMSTKYTVDVFILHLSVLCFKQEKCVFTLAYSWVERYEELKLPKYSASFFMNCDCNLLR